MATQANQLPIFLVKMGLKMYLAWMRDMKAGQILTKCNNYFVFKSSQLVSTKINHIFIYIYQAIKVK